MNTFETPRIQVVADLTKLYPDDSNDWEIMPFYDQSTLTIVDISK